MRWIATVGLLLASVSANATLITLDPSAYGAGTNLSQVQDGLTISRLTWPTGSPYGAPNPATRSDVVATSCVGNYHSCLSADGLGFGNTYIVHEYEACVRGSSICGSTIALEFTFRDLTSDVALTFTWGSDAPMMLAYDGDGNLLETCNGYGGSCGTFFQGESPWHRGTVLNINREQRDIYRIVAGGLIGSSFAHSLTYSVPEPSTIALLSIGLLGIGLRRRSRR